MNAETKPIAVVLVSGGMDSCVTAAEARAAGFELAMLHGNYGQRTEGRELRSFHAIADRMGVPRERRLVANLPHLGAIGGSSLTDPSIPIESSPLAASAGAAEEAQRSHEGELAPAAGRAASDTARTGMARSFPPGESGSGIALRGATPSSPPCESEAEGALTGVTRPLTPGGSGSDDARTVMAPPLLRPGRASGEGGSTGAGRAAIPGTYVPFRNAHFLVVAVSWAEVLGARAVYIGAVEEDSSGYPDCREEYLRAFERVVELGTRPGSGIRIVAPLIHCDKAEIVRRGLALRAPLELTWSCYCADDVACGTCDSCALRLRGFARAGVRDPIPYARRLG